MHFLHLGTAFTIVAGTFINGASPSLDNRLKDVEQWWFFGIRRLSAPEQLKLANDRTGSNKVMVTLIHHFKVVYF